MRTLLGRTAHPGRNETGSATTGPHWGTIAFVLLGLVVGAVFVTVTANAYNNSEARLLKVRARDAAASIAAEAPGIQTSLASGALLSDSSGHTKAFTDYMRQFVGQDGGPVAAELFSLPHSQPRMLTHVGATPLIGTDPLFEKEQLTEARQARLVTMRVVSGAGGRRIVFAYSPFRSSNVAVEEFPLRGLGVLKLPYDSSLRGLRYAVYVGSFAYKRELVATNQKTLPLTGRTASLIVPFGSDWYFLVVSSKSSLAGTFFEVLPYVVGIVSLLLVVAGAIMVELLGRRQLLAEGLRRQLTDDRPSSND